jgi:hypothetical protein
MFTWNNLIINSDDEEGWTVETRYAVFQGVDIINAEISFILDSFRNDFNGSSKYK